MFADRRLRAVRAAKAGKPREPIRHGSAVFNGRELRMMIIIGLMVAVAAYATMRSGAHVAPAKNETAVHKAPAEETETETGSHAASRPVPGGSVAPAATAERRRVNRLLRGVVVQPEAVRALDMSTFEVRGARIRIADMDAPALAGACPHEIGLAQRGFRRLREWMAIGPFELSEAGGRDRDREGRRLRVVSRDGESVGTLLIGEGLARPFSGQTQPWCAIGESIL